MKKPRTEKNVVVAVELVVVYEQKLRNREPWAVVLDWERTFIIWFSLSAKHLRTLVSNVLGQSTAVAGVKIVEEICSEPSRNKLGLGDDCT